VETAKAAAAGKKVKPKGHRLFFTSQEALRQFLIPKKLELIRLVRQRRPVPSTSLRYLRIVTLREFIKTSGA
jgi:predicted transcriptional regulator